MRIAAHPIILTIIIFFLFLQPAASSIINGRLAEWSMAAVLKTVERQRSGGSNPSPSAKRNTAGRVATGCFWLQARRKPAFVRAGRQKRPAGQQGQQLYSVLHSPAAGGEGCRRASARRNPEGKAWPMPPQGMRGASPTKSLSKGREGASQKTVKHLETRCFTLSG